MYPKRPKPAFFAEAAEFRAWLDEHHAIAEELWVGYCNKDSGRPSLTWPESVEQALRYGWIDGIRKRLDAHRYTIRFTRRKPRSVWSAINIRMARQLLERGEMHPAGKRAFDARRENRSGIYSYEQRSVDLPESYARLFRKNRAAWAFYQAQPAGYRKATCWWIISAKKEETRLKRLAILAAHSARAERLPALASPRARA